MRVLIIPPKRPSIRPACPTRSGRDFGVREEVSRTPWDVATVDGQELSSVRDETLIELPRRNRALVTFDKKLRRVFRFSPDGRFIAGASSNDLGIWSSRGRPRSASRSAGRPLAAPWPQLSCAVSSEDRQPRTASTGVRGRGRRNCLQLSHAVLGQSRRQRAPTCWRTTPRDRRSVSAQQHGDARPASRSDAASSPPRRGRGAAW